MSATEPLVSVGLPVYNGERYIREAIESILAQDYANLELVISDNASQDATEAICREYAARDPRVRYFRAPENMGAVWNFNRVFELSRGELFMWTAFDDRRHHRYVGRCVEALRSDPQAVLACTDVQLIDEDGHELDDPNWPRGIHPAGRTAHERAGQVARATFWYDFYGLMRSEVLRRTRLAQNVWGFDVVVLLEMCLRGPVAVVPEPLFAYRVFVRKMQQDLADTLAPERARGAIPVSWTEFSALLLRSILEAPLPLRERVSIARRFAVDFCYRNPTVRPGIYADAPATLRRAMAERRYGMAAGAAALRLLVTLIARAERLLGPGRGAADAGGRLYATRGP